MSLLEVQTEVEALGPSEMLILDHTGETKLIWDRNRPEEVKAAKEHFETLRGKRYLAFRAEVSEGYRGSQMDKFDPTAERIIMVPPMVGG